MMAISRPGIGIGGKISQEMPPCLWNFTKSGQVEQDPLLTLLAVLIAKSILSPARRAEHPNKLKKAQQSAWKAGLNMWSS